MGARKPGAWLLNVAVLGGLLMIPCPAQGASAAKEELLQFLVERNEAAWQEIQSLTSIQYRLDREWLDRRSQRPFHATAQVKKTGHCLWCMYRVETHTGPLQVVEERQVQGSREDAVVRP